MQLQKTRAVYYARVSTEEEKQVNALQKQCQEAEYCVSSQGWELVDKYIDEGKSGTTSNKRDEYNRLFEELSSNKFDIIVIKSQDRLMRNVKDWYLFIDKMVKNGKRLFFYIENKFYQSDDSLITGIKAILAEEYSRELSKKINNSNRRRQENATSIITNGKLWGYDQKNGELTINEKEAKVVRRIFELYIAGYGCRSIRKMLTNEGFLTRNATEFAETTIKRMIKNEKYKGTVIFNKQHKDFETKRIIQNPPEEWIIHEDRIPAIIDKNTWEEANRIMRERAVQAGANDRIDKKVGYNKSKNKFGGKIICGDCGKVYYRRHIKNAKRDAFKYVWECSTYVQRGRIHPLKKSKNKYVDVAGWVGCDNINIEETQLLNLMNELSEYCEVDIKFIVDKMTEYLREMYMSLYSEVNVEEIENDIKKYSKQKSFLLDKYMEGIVSENDYKNKNEELEILINKLNAQMLEYENAQNTKEEIETKLQYIRKQIEEEIVTEERYNFIIDRVKRIVVYQDHLNVELDIIGDIYVEVGEDKSLNVINTRPH